MIADCYPGQAANPRLLVRAATRSHNDCKRQQLWEWSDHPKRGLQWFVAMGD